MESGGSRSPRRKRRREHNVLREAFGVLAPRRFRFFAANLYVIYTRILFGRATAKSFERSERASISVLDPWPGQLI